MSLSKANLDADGAASELGGRAPSSLGDSHGLMMVVKDSKQEGNVVVQLFCSYLIFGGALRSYGTLLLRSGSLLFVLSS